MKAQTVLGVLVTLCVFFEAVHGQFDDTRRFEKLILNIRRGLYRNLTDDLVNPLLEIYAPTSEAVQNEECRKDSEHYKEAVKDGTTWALRMLDSGSKISSGLMTGNAVGLGNYDECLMVTSDEEDTSSHPFQGQHCMVKAVSIPKVYYGTSEETNSNTRFLGELTLLLGSKWSVCIPSSCTSRDLQAHLRSLLKVMHDTVEVTVGDDACRSRAHPQVLTPADWFAVVLLMFFAVLVAASTAYDLRGTKSASRSALFVSFSVYTNGRKLLTLSPGSDELLALHGIRTLSMLWIIIGHSYDFIMVESPSVNSLDFHKFRNSWSHAALLQYRLAVDSFLLLSGLLLCYGFLKERTRGDTFNIARFYVHRYIRLTPAYAIMIILMATLLYHSDDGPMWGEVVGTAQKNCQNYWWTGLLYVNNYIQPRNMCMEQSWYLSVDMQLYLVSPLILYPLWRWRRVGKYLLGLTIAAGITTNFTIRWLNPYAHRFEYDYYPTHARFTPWLMGIALGCYLHTTKNTRPNLSRPVLAGGWILSAALLISPIAANHVLQNMYISWEISLNSALNKPAWALGLSWIIFSCSNGFGGFVNTFLSCKIFQLLSRLTYCVYLVHFALILWLTGSIRTPFYVNDKTMLTMFLNTTVLAFIAAPVLSLVFEVPALTIEKILLGKGMPSEGIMAKNDVQTGAPRDNMLGEELLEISK